MNKLWKARHHWNAWFGPKTLQILIFVYDFKSVQLYRNICGILDLDILDLMIPLELRIGKITAVIYHHKTKEAKNQGN